ncbi:MAG: WxcM-like domain-containing protein [Saprospiraceae bacterium]|nr:WxcM-like domain-containing protein [Saprospiraceae bacterium]
MVRIIDLPKIVDQRGNLTFIQYPDHIPFQIKRTFWIYDVPGGEVRGGHAYKTQQEIIIALSGSFNVVVNDGKKTSTYHLHRSYNALYIPPMVWRHIENFSTNSLSFHISDEKFNEEDYLRNFDEFISKIK